MMRMLANILMLVGAVGVCFLLSKNLYEVMLLEEPSSAFFSTGWWSDYWALYVALGGVLVLGMVCALTTRKS